MAVEVEHDPVGLPPRLLDPAQIVLDIRLVALACDLEAVAAHEALAQERQFVLPVGAHFGLAEKMLALARTLLLEAELTADALELVERLAVDRIGVLEAERIDPGPPVQIRALRAGLVPGPERRGGGEDRDSPAARIEIAGHARLGEVCSTAGMRDAGGVEVPRGGEEPALAIVEGVVIGAGDHVDAEPLDVLKQLGWRGHERAL